MYDLSMSNSGGTIAIVIVCLMGAAGAPFKHKQPEYQPPPIYPSVQLPTRGQTDGSCPERIESWYTQQYTFYNSAEFAASLAVARKAMKTFGYVLDDLTVDHYLKELAAERTHELDHC